MTNRATRGAAARGCVAVLLGALASCAQPRAESANSTVRSDAPALPPDRAPSPALTSGSAPDAVVAPPADVVSRFRLSPFYTQYTGREGLPIVGSSRVSRFALLEASYLVDKMVGPRTEILRAMASNNVRLAVMATTELTTDIPEHSDLTPKAYWDRRARGLGATDVRPAVSAAEENLLDLPGDPYATENILVHEFGHAIHERGMNVVDPTFDQRLGAAYDHAISTGLWRNTYAATNRMEYWAEATQSWFDCNRVNDAQHGPIDTRDKLVPYDPQVAVLLREVYGDRPWRYAKPSRRPIAERAHLVGFDAARAGSFAWPDARPLPGPERLLSWIARGALPHASPPGGRATSVAFVNERSEAVTLEWLDFTGNRKHYAVVQPKATALQATFAGHVWVASDRTGVLGAVVATDEPGRAEIK